MAQEQNLAPFQVEVFTPVGALLKGEATSVKLPGKDGELGILTNHRDYAGLLGTGIMEFECTVSGSCKRIAISEGFCSFKAGTLRVLADVAYTPETIDAETYDAEREQLQEIMQSGYLLDPERVEAQQALRRIEVVDKLISH